MLSGTCSRATVRALLPLLLIHLAALRAFGDEPLAPTLTNAEPNELWFFLPIGYLLTVLIETPVLLVGLPRQLSFKQRAFAGLWLTACTYPIVILVLPVLFASSPRALYLLVAETFAPVAECALFWLAFRHRLAPGAAALARSFATIILANLLSFGIGELLNAVRWFGLF